MLVLATTLALCAAVAAGDGILPHAPAPQLNVNVASTGNFEVVVNGKVWLNSSNTAVLFKGTWLSASDGTLVPTPTTNTGGSDGFGQYYLHEFNWVSPAARDVVFTTRIRDYTGRIPLIVTEHSFPKGLQATGNGNRADLATRFPTFTGEPAVPLGYLTFAGNMACPDTVLQCTWQGKYTASEWDLVPGGISGGVPLALFDETPEQNTIIISPASEFMASSQARVQDPSALAFGLMGTYEFMPPGFTMTTMLYAGSGISATFEGWGALLRGKFGKDREVSHSDFTTQYLGYYTDNGGYYYYNTGKYSDYNTALTAVTDNAQADHIPYRYMQLDSWWYYKGEANGVLNWTAMPSALPQGLGALSASTGLRFVAHNRYWSDKTQYATANGGAYDFVVEPANTKSIPMETRFWSDLMANSSRWGLVTYEQDWLHNEFEDMNITLSDPTVGRQWLLQMGAGAAANGITIQYCMPYPRHILQSLEVPAVTQTRVSDDYHPGNDQFSIGVSSMLAHSVGLVPWKDDFWSHNGPEPGNHWSPQTQETAAALEAAVSVLSTGPVGPSDCVGCQNRTNIMRTCAVDGTLLHPSRPATAIDSTFAFRSFGKGGPDGEVWQTYSEVGGITWGSVLVAALNAPFTLARSELQIPLSGPFGNTSYYAWQDTMPGSLTNFNGPQLAFPALDKTSFQLWHLAPAFLEMPGGDFVVLGETSKFVPMSPNRFTRATLDQQGALTFTLAGAPGEQVTVTWAALNGSGGGAQSSVTCTLSSWGRATLALPAGVCADA